MDKSPGDVALGERLRKLVVWSSLKQNLHFGLLFLVIFLLLSLRWWDVSLSQPSPFTRLHRLLCRNNCSTEKNNVFSYGPHSPAEQIMTKASVIAASKLKFWKSTLKTQRSSTPKRQTLSTSKRQTLSTSKRQTPSTSKRHTLSTPRSRKISTTVLPMFTTRTPNTTIHAFLRATATTRMTQQQKTVYMHTLLLFDHIWRKQLNLTYFLYGGSLLGAARHRGFMPWDDDIDLLINLKDQHLLGTVFKNTNLSMRTQGSYKRKIFFTKLLPGMRRTWVGWNWPFLDIFCYTFIKNGTVVSDPSTGYFRVNTSRIFPVRFLTFEGYQFPAPRCPFNALQTIYDPGFMKTCCPNSYNHQYEGGASWAKCVPCSRLQPYFRNASFTSIDPDPKSCD